MRGAPRAFATVPLTGCGQTRSDRRTRLRRERRRNVPSLVFRHLPQRRRGPPPAPPPPPPPPRGLRPPPVGRRFPAPRPFPSRRGSDGAPCAISMIGARGAEPWLIP